MTNVTCVNRDTYPVFVCTNGPVSMNLRRHIWSMVCVRMRGFAREWESRFV